MLDSSLIVPQPEFVSRPVRTRKKHAGFPHPTGLKRQRQPSPSWTRVPRFPRQSPGMLWVAGRASTSSVCQEFTMLDCTFSVAYLDTPRADFASVFASGCHFSPRVRSQRSYLKSISYQVLWAIALSNVRAAWGGQKEEEKSGDFQLPNSTNKSLKNQG